MTDSKDWRNSTAIAIVGVRGSGKTALACSVLDSITDRPVFVYAHPREELVIERGWIPMYRLEEMTGIQSAVVWIDEPQVSMPKLDKRANEALQKLLSIARHRDLTLIFSTCDTRWITRALESYIDVWFVCDIEPRLVKQGALIKKIIQRYVVMDVDEFELQPGQYLAYGRKFREFHGTEPRTFALPEWWDERYSKPYALQSDVARIRLAEVVNG